TYFHHIPTETFDLNAVSNQIRAPKDQIDPSYKRGNGCLERKPQHNRNQSERCGSGIEILEQKRTGQNKAKRFGQKPSDPQKVISVSLVVNLRGDYFRNHLADQEDHRDQKQDYTQLFYYRRIIPPRVENFQIYQIIKDDQQNSNNSIG